MIDAWKAALSRRWHTNADLAHTVDPVAAHGARVAVLAMLIDPNLSGGAIRVAVLHDWGEYRVGDFPAPFKWDNPDIAEILAAKEADAIEAMGLSLPQLSDDEAALIKMCDMLDSWLWCKQHRPDLMRREDWRELGWVIANMAEDRGCAATVLRVMGVVHGA